MTVRTSYNYNERGRNPFGTFGTILAIIIFLFVLSYVVKGIFTVLSWVAPILLIATLILDRKVIVDYGKFLLRLVKDNTLVGILGIILTVFAFPAVIGFLFVKMLTKRFVKSKMEDMETKRNGELVEYEVVEDDEDFLDLPTIEKTKATSSHSTSSNEYDNLFE